MDRQIICHGVDVSKCDRLNLNSAYGWDDPDMCSITCCKNGPNCLFKQLARKTQECEELKEKLRELELKNTTLQNRNQQLNGSMAKADRYREALEEIEEVCLKVCSICWIKNKCNKEYSNCKDAEILTIINKAKGEGND